MTRRIMLGCLAVLLGSFLSAPLSRAEEPNLDAAKQAAAKHKAKMAQGGTWTGRIAALEKDDVSFAFTTEIVIPYFELVPRRNAAGQIIGWRRRDHVYRESVRVEVWLPAEVSVRLPPKPAKDANGRPIPSLEKKGSNGPGRPAYGVAGTVKDLKQGQTVQVTLERDRDRHLFAKVICVLQER